MKHEAEIQEEKNNQKNIQEEISVSLTRFKKMTSALDEQIRNFSLDISAKKVDLTEIFDKGIFELDNDLEERIEKFSVYPTMDSEQRKNIAKQYNDNMKLYIKDFLDEEIKELRTNVSSFITKGARPEQISKELMSRYGVSKSKAKFLARQESNLLVVELQKSQYTKAGIDKYIWRTVRGSAASPVRSTHKIHDNKTYSWNDPPLVGDQRLHPGQDFNCRCVAVPVVEF
jgi:SPP1 gp7 family putative phage head morphogenesis protein